MAHVYNSQLVKEASSETTIFQADLQFQDAFDLYHLSQTPTETSKSLLNGPALPALGHALAGSTGAAISNVVTYPLALIITRLQIQRQLPKNSSQAYSEEYKSVRDAAKKIYDQEGGWRGLYTGVLPDMLKTITDSFLFFLAYNFIRQSRLQSRKPSAKHLPAIDELGVGFLAGAFSKFLTTPIANVVTRKQASAMISGRHSHREVKTDSVRSIILQIQSKKGLQGFWSGYSASLVLTLNPSLTFFLFETFKRTLLPHKHRSHPPPRATFLLAAISKAIASTITYPFSLAKSRAQASSSSLDHSASDENEHENTAPTRSPSAREKLSNYGPRNVFRTILHIARTEGIGALYEGLEGEVLKGFFSNGITMLVKDTVHKFIIQLYYVVLKLLKRYPSPQELAESVKEQAAEARDGLENQTGHLIVTAKNGAEIIIGRGHEAMKNVSAQLSPTTKREDGE